MYGAEIEVDWRIIIEKPLLLACSRKPRDVLTNEPPRTRQDIACEIELLDSATARDTRERELERVRRWYGCFITGYAVMPEHVHLLISEPSGESSQRAIGRSALGSEIHITTGICGWGERNGKVVESSFRGRIVRQGVL